VDNPPRNALERESQRGAQEERERNPRTVSDPLSLFRKEASIPATNESAKAENSPIEELL